MQFIKKKTFYPFPVYEWNLPAGHTCPFARDCKIKVDRVTGKFETTGTKFRCYAALSERFPAVRESRWRNYEELLETQNIILPKGATHIRIHGSGDFFSQWYFDLWLQIAIDNPQIKFWTFTKSISYWLARRNNIPSNYTIQASYGSSQEDLIEQNGLKFAKVFSTIEDVKKSGLPIDYDDSLAMSGTQSFALLDNNKFSKKRRIKL